MQNLQGTRGHGAVKGRSCLIPLYDSRDEGKAGDVYVDFSQTFVPTFSWINCLLRAWVGALLIE